MSAVGALGDDHHTLIDITGRGGEIRQIPGDGVDRHLRDFLVIHFRYLFSIASVLCCRVLPVP